MPTRLKPKLFTALRTGYTREQFFADLSAGVIVALLLAATAGWAATPKVIRSGSPHQKKIALTFDACATQAPSRVDQKVISVLTATQTHATFFLGGKWMIDHPAETRALAAVPEFELGNHSYLHPHPTRVTGRRVTRELDTTQKILFSLTGRTARWFRPPYGEWSPAVAETAATLGLTTVLFTFASGDPDTQATAPKLVNYVVQKAKNGAIVVMHVNGRGWHTAEALPEIIARLKARGFTLVTVGELLGETGEGTDHRQRALTH